MPEAASDTSSCSMSGSSSEFVVAILPSAALCRASARCWLKRARNAKPVAAVLIRHCSSIKYHKSGSAAVNSVCFVRDVIHPRRRSRQQRRQTHRVDEDESRRLAVAQRARQCVCRAACAAAKCLLQHSSGGRKDRIEPRSARTEELMRRHQHMAAVPKNGLAGACYSVSRG